MTTPTCEICNTNPIIIDDLWGETDTCVDCNDGAPMEQWEVTTPSQVWDV